MACALVVLACTAGCTTVSDTPATAPSTNATSSTTSTTQPGSTSTVVAPETTTTLDRVSEIQAIFLDLEHRRLHAILDQDEEAYRAVFANEYYEQESMVAFDMVEVIDPDAVSIAVVEVLVDRPDCIAASVQSDLSLATIGGGVATSDWVLEPRNPGWGWSWVGEGWRCDRAHPLSP